MLSGVATQLENADPLTRIGAHIRKVPSIENGGETSRTGERARMGTSARQASPRSEGDRKLQSSYIRRYGGLQGIPASGAAAVRSFEHRGENFGELCFRGNAERTKIAPETHTALVGSSLHTLPKRVFCPPSATPFFVLSICPLGKYPQ